MAALWKHIDVGLEEGRGIVDLSRIKVAENDSVLQRIGTVFCGTVSIRCRPDGTERFPVLFVLDVVRH